MENFSGPVDEAERRRMGNQRFVGGPEYAGRGPLDKFGGSEEHYSEIAELRKLEKKLDGVNSGILEVEQHIIERMKTEVGSNNMKAWAESLEIVRKLERRNA